MTRTFLRRIAREPLLHFLLLGAGIFALYAMTGTSPDAASERIVVTTGQIENLVGVWMRTRMRTPTQQELDGLVADLVKEELYAREARAMNLDEGDPVIGCRVLDHRQSGRISDLNLKGET